MSAKSRKRPTVDNFKGFINVVDSLQASTEKAQYIHANHEYKFKLKHEIQIPIIEVHKYKYSARERILEDWVGKDLVEACSQRAEGIYLCSKWAKHHQQKKGKTGSI